MIYHWLIFFFLLKPAHSEMDIYNPFIYYWRFTLYQGFLSCTRISLLLLDKSIDNISLICSQVVDNWRRKALVIYLLFEDITYRSRMFFSLNLANLLIMRQARHAATCRVNRLVVCRWCECLAWLRQATPSSATCTASVLTSMSRAPLLWRKNTCLPSRWLLF